jgi:hypothetical protein
LHVSDTLHAPASVAVQHGSPGPPHVRHVEGDVAAEHASEEPRQVDPLQHGSPGPPHALQTVFEPVVVSHDTCGAVQPIVVQQFCPGPPHTAHPASPQALPHVEFSQRSPLVGHTDPDGVQMSSTQHPPAAQIEPPQHGSPGPPQAAQ